MHRFGAVVVGLFVVLAVPVLAQGTGKPAATKVQVTAADCRRLFTEHRPAADVAYKPGVDVNGRPVAGADLNPAPQIKVPDTVTFDIAVDLTKYGLPAGSPLFQPNVKLGQVQMDLLSGKVLYNGEALGNPEIEALREACRQQGLAPR
ncbi:MAG: hypothetical protein JNN22_07055 [Rhodospirillales bacterium]|nr:hypothetical protein [Rhodospirillales bacterium]